MRTVTDELQQRAEHIKSLAETFLVQHAGLERDWLLNNPDGHGIISLGGDHDWKAIDEDGQRMQSQIRIEFNHFLDIVRTLLRSQPDGVMSQCNDAAYHIQEIIDQHCPTWYKTTAEALQRFQSAIDAQIQLLAGLYDASDGTVVYVPDTNALLYCPQLEDWEFATSPLFTVILMPTVLSELDQLKVHHRNEDVRQRTDGLIRRIKGYRSRGKLAEGVPLRTGRSTLRTLAIEPDMNNTLPWLDAGNNDDRILAGLVEVMRIHPRCPVLLVTRDINLQNKAEHAGLLFVEPPEPPASTP